jgi:hypothetical protein
MGHGALPIANFTSAVAALPMRCVGGIRPGDTVMMMAERAGVARSALRRADGGAMLNALNYRLDARSIGFKGTAPPNC